MKDRAADYDAWYRHGLGAVAHEIELEQIAEAALPVTGERALDAGCGTGIYAAWLARFGLVVTGIDCDQELLAAARRKTPGAHFVDGEVTRLPFADGSFDLVLAVTLFCFLSPPARQVAARELVRVTRPGGRVVVGELARFSLWAAKRRLRGRLGSPGWRTARFTTNAELERLLREAGATRVSSRHALYMPPVDVPALLRRAQAIERFGRRLGPAGAAFVVCRADVGGGGQARRAFERFPDARGPAGE